MSLDKSMGILYGLAIGDALGKPTEFISLPEIKKSYGEKGIIELPDPAFFTDDTQMSILIAEALSKSGNDDIESTMLDIKDGFVKWVYSDDWFNGGAGHTCTQGVLNMKKGVHWSESGIVGSKGCGSAMRAAPIGYFYQNNVGKLREVAHASGICTHNHPTADAACIGAAYLVKLALDGVDPSDMIYDLLDFTENISSEWEISMLQVKHCLDWSDEEKALEYLGEGWVGEEAVALALYCFLRYPDDYKKVIIRAANTNGDSDSIACIAGAISGAYLGVENIPKHWIDVIEKKEYLKDLATRITNWRIKNEEFYE